MSKGKLSAARWLACLGSLAFAFTAQSTHSFARTRLGGGVRAHTQTGANSSELQVSQATSQIMQGQPLVWVLTNPHRKTLDVVYSLGDPGLNPSTTETWDESIANGTDVNDTSTGIIAPGQSITTDDFSSFPMYYWVCPAGQWAFDPILGRQPRWSSHVNGHRVVCSTQLPKANWDPVSGKPT